MKCPSCGFLETKVTNSRLSTDAEAVRRRRECERCSFRFTTYEEREPIHFFVKKKNGSAEPYQRLKLESGIRKALEKRPVSEDKIKQLVIAIEQEFVSADAQVVESAAIGEAVLKHLASLDKVAYVRFASVYKEFKTMTGFLREIQRLAKR